MADKETINLTALAYAKDFGEAQSSIDHCFWQLYGNIGHANRVLCAHNLLRECRKLVKAAEMLRHSFENCGNDG